MLRKLLAKVPGSKYYSLFKGCVHFGFRPRQQPVILYSCISSSNEINIIYWIAARSFSRGLVIVVPFFQKIKLNPELFSILTVVIFEFLSPVTTKLICWDAFQTMSPYLMHL